MRNYIVIEMRNERGISMVMVMGILIILGILATVLVVTGIREVRIGSVNASSKIAFHAAEAGLNFGIADIPMVVSPFPASPDTWATLSNQASYKSGFPDSLPSAPKQIGQAYVPGFSIEENTKLVGLKYDVVTSGKMAKSRRVIRARIDCGPMPSGTRY